MTRKYFGTDGVRGRVGQFPITPDFMLRLGWATGVAFRKKGVCRILVGKDTRISGYMFESALEAGLASAGVNVQLLGPMPTPAVAYLTRTFHADAGIVISASHNGHHDNGIKFFSSKGTKLPDETELMIEELLDRPMEVVESNSLGKASRINDAAGRYIEFCKSTVPNHTSFEGMKIVLDCANGATYKVAPNVFKELGADVVSLFVHPNGLNINDNCGSTHPEQLVEAVKNHQADIGIGFDGDGDRVVMVDRSAGGRWQRAPRHPRRALLAAAGMARAGCRTVSNGSRRTAQRHERCARIPCRALPPLPCRRPGRSRAGVERGPGRIHRRSGRQPNPRCAHRCITS